MTVGSGYFIKSSSFATCIELDLEYCLNRGQTFSWKKIDKYWINAFSGGLLVVLSIEDNHIHVWHDGDAIFGEKLLNFVKSYFRMEFKLQDLYKDWSRRDSFFAKQAQGCEGVRLLQQPPFEALISFICSQNNGIKRIGTMVHSLKETFGTRLEFALPDGVKGEAFTFPTPHQLSAVPNLTERLNEMGFGYRSRYIKMISDEICGITGGDDPLCLTDLMMRPYEEVFARLLKVTGIGPKVADCVALTGLGKMEAIPIDTHIWQIAKKHYSGMPAIKSLTLKCYMEIGSKFRSIFGPMTGWAHLILFAAKLDQKRNTK